MIFKLARSDPLMIEKYQNRTIRLPLTTYAFSDLNNAGSSGRSSEVFFLNMEDGFFGCQVSEIFKLRTSVHQRKGNMAFDCYDGTEITVQSLHSFAPLFGSRIEL